METEEQTGKMINRIYIDLTKNTAEMEFRVNGNRINGGESVDQILKLRNLDALNKLPKPNHCFCIKNFGKCYTCEL